MPPLAGLLEGICAVEHRALGERRAPNALAAAACQPLRPMQPHWFLACVGTLPDARGRGIGTELLRPVLDRCDSQRTLAALETSSADNLRLYRRLGFAVTGELDRPAGAPHVWVMTRRPHDGCAPDAPATRTPRDVPCDG